LKYFSTHPSPAERIERLKALAATAPGPPVPLLPGTDWEDVKRICEIKADGARRTGFDDYRLRIERVADLAPPLYEAEMVTAVLEDPFFVAMVKLTDDIPAGTVTLGGTDAADVLELASVITAPPADAGPDSVTVPVELAPPLTVVGLRVSDE